jgi:hypothetical protein
LIREVHRLFDSKVTLKLNFDGGDCGSRKCKRGYGGASRSLESGGQFCVGAFAQESGSSLREDVFTFNLLLKSFKNSVVSVQFAMLVLH